MAVKKKVVKEVIKKIEKQLEREPNLVKVLDKITKERIILDVNKEPDYKKKYLHISWEKFTD